MELRSDARDWRQSLEQELQLWNCSYDVQQQRPPETTNGHSVSRVTVKPMLLTLALLADTNIDYRNENRKQKVKSDKQKVTMHSLRHSFATHLREAGDRFAVYPGMIGACRQQDN